MEIYRFKYKGRTISTKRENKVDAERFFSDYISKLEEIEKKEEEERKKLWANTDFSKRQDFDDYERDTFYALSDGSGDIYSRDEYNPDDDACQWNIT